MVTKPMIASCERPIWTEAKGLSSVKEQDWYWELENRKGNDGFYESQGHPYDLEFILGALWQFLVREIPHVMKFVPQILAFSNGYHTDTNKCRMEDSFSQGPQKSLETANRGLPPKPRRNLCAHNVRTCERVQLASLPVRAIQTLRQTATKRKSASRFWHRPVKMCMVFQEAWWSLRHRDA